MLARAPLVLLTVATAACVSTGATTIAHPTAAGIPRNVVAVPNEWGDELLLGLPNGALTSHASLVALTDSRTCFDVLLRTFKGATHRWDVHAEVDGRGVDVSPEMLLQCSAGEACLPSDTAVPSLATDADGDVHRHAARICFERLPQPKRELVLSTGQGALQIRFVWRLGAVASR